MIGFSTYAYFWRMSSLVPSPMSIQDVLRDTAAAGVSLFQICDYARLNSFTAKQLVELRALADDLGITLELGTRGTRPAILHEYLRLADALGASLVRSMWTVGHDRPTAKETDRRLRTVMPSFEASGVVLALETYEQVNSVDLVNVVASIDSEALGICLDPANSVANLELPSHVTERCDPYVRNWHVKDFDFVREPGWVGFSLLGVPLGSGRLDYRGMRALLDPDARGINQIIEHWLPWQGDPETTTQLEAEWTLSNLTYLRSEQND